jgi:hypothetical protein
MGNPRCLTVKVGPDEAIRVTRMSIRRERLCYYMIVADKRQRCKKGRS